MKSCQYIYNKADIGGALFFEENLESQSSRIFEKTQFNHNKAKVTGNSLSAKILKNFTFLTDFSPYNSRRNSFDVYNLKSGEIYHECLMKISGFD